MSAGAGEDASLDEDERRDLATRLALLQGSPPMQHHETEQLVGTLCFLSTLELQCLLAYLLTKHGQALGPGGGAGGAGGELLSSSTAIAAAAAARGSLSGSGSGSDEIGSSTPDLDGAASGMVVRSSKRRRQQQGGARRRHHLPSYDPGCASVFAFG